MALPQFGYRLTITDVIGSTKVTNVTMSAGNLNFDFDALGAAPPSMVFPLIKCKLELSTIVQGADPNFPKGVVHWGFIKAT